MHTTRKGGVLGDTPILAFVLALALAGCGGAAVVIPQVELPERARHGNLDRSSAEVVEVDHNGDGAVDERSWFRSGVPVWTERDTDFDGRFDFYAHYDARGQIVEVELVHGLEDRVSAVLTYAGGVLQREEFYTGDAPVPTLETLFTPGGEPLEVRRDRDGDGRVDAAWRIEAGQLVRVPLSPATSGPGGGSEPPR